MSDASIESPDELEAELKARRVAKQRTCLVCRTPFQSAWAGERICPRCKSTKAWRSGVAPESTGGNGGG